MARVGDNFNPQAPKTNVKVVADNFNAPRVGPAEPPSVVQNLVAEARNGGARLTWDAPASEGTSPVTNYLVLLWPAQNPANALSYVVPATAVRELIVSSLVNGQAYAGTIAANSAQASGDQLGFTVTPVTDAVDPGNPTDPVGQVPGAVTLVSVQPGPASARAQWTPGYTGSSAITGYTITASDLDDPDVQADATLEVLATQDVMVDPGVDPTADVLATIVGLLDGQDFTVTVSAFNAAGRGPESNAIVVTPAADLPVLDPPPVVVDPPVTVPPAQAPEPMTFGFPPLVAFRPIYSGLTTEQALAYEADEAAAIAANEIAEGA